MNSSTKNQGHSLSALSSPLLVITLMQAQEILEIKTKLSTLNPSEINPLEY